MKNVDMKFHVTGESVFIDDLPAPEGLLEAAVFGSPFAAGKVKSLDVSGALESKGVVAVITADDIPGRNQVGSIIEDEPLLAEGEVHFIGHPVAVVLATTREAALFARKKIQIEVDPHEAVTDPRVAFEKGDLIAPSRTFRLGDVDAAYENCDVVIEGRAESGGQEHFYLETQVAMSMPLERGGIFCYSSTQNPTAVQKMIARVLGVSMNLVEVDTRRLGGAFGGKEEQATPWACMTAVAARVTGRPVRLMLPRNDDLLMTGKRHPYSSDFKIGLKSDGTILCYEADIFQNAGASADLSTSVLERTLLHCTNSYFVPNVRVTATPCRTNLPPFTAYRGFGGPQGMFVIEAAIDKAADHLGMSAAEIQKKNLLSEGDAFPYGQEAEHCRIKRCFDELKTFTDYEKRIFGVKDFNGQNDRFKKGLSIQPVTFGISFTTIFLNQARCLVHVYTDGSVSVSTGAVEMGQGVNMKMLLIAAKVFGIDSSRVKVETTNTSRVANTSPTAASSGADLNGKAVEVACTEILSRLKEFAKVEYSADEVSVENEKLILDGKESEIGWDELITQAYFSRVNLSEEGHFATPKLYFDKRIEKGHAFAYHAYGAALSEVTVDGLLGTYTIDRVDIVHDFGQSLNPLIDKGQVEGALVQGIGWLTMEDLKISEDGRMRNASTSAYKVPDAGFIPEINIQFLKDADNPYAVMNSKAIGEPPFMYGLGSYFALLNAVKAFGKKISYDAPLIPEKLWGYLNEN